MSDSAHLFTPRPRRLEVALVLATTLVLAPACKSGGGQPDPSASSKSGGDGAGPGDAKTDARQPKRSGGLSDLPEVIASVDGHDISRAEFELRYAPTAAMVLARRDDGKVPDPFQAMQRRKIIEGLAWSKQLELEAARTKVDYAPEELAKHELEEREHVLDWNAWLDRIGQTVEIRHQANVDYLRERALFAARGVSLEPTEAELLAAFEANRDSFVAPEELVRGSHLLITYGPRVADEKIQPMMPEQAKAASAEQTAAWDQLALARAKALRAVALDPEVDFNELARTFSEGPGAYRGGDMGLFPRRQMVGEYADAAFALKPGEISEPIKSEKGYYVMKSFGRYPKGPLPFEAVRADLVRQLEGEKYKQAHAALQAELDERFPIVSSTLDEARAFKK